jgi:uncharacterized protein (DUF1800 family)
MSVPGARLHLATTRRKDRRIIPAVKIAAGPLSLVLLLSACAGTPRPAPVAPPAPIAPIAWPDDAPGVQVELLNRVTWGASRSSFERIRRLGASEFLARELRPQGEAKLPAEVQARIDAMTISQKPMAEIAAEMAGQRRAFLHLPPEERKPAQQAYQKELTRLGREAQARMLLRALYSPQQLKEQMTWFWMNHFSVFQFKLNVRALVADYEEHAIRPNALGRFRDLLGASARHPAMLLYLDNARNAAGHINENYARELMELHTLGVNGGYTQRDVQELARVLTGFSVTVPGGGAYRFYPRRHDWGDKVLLGRTIRGRGEAELDQALDILASEPATARFVSRKLAVYFVADEPPPALVERMAQTFLSTDGDIAATLAAMFGSAEFRASLGGEFKDPMHYVVSALRLVLDERPIANAQPAIGAVGLLGEPLYARPTPDGYPLKRTDWASPGQLATRFDVARAIGYRVPYRVWQEGVPNLGPATLQALGKASSAREWNMLLLASPEFMQR